MKMSEDQFRKLPTASITKALADSQIQCSVCLDIFQFNESGVRKLPCDHLYHDKCIFPWLQRNASCPYCRAKLPNAEPNIEHLDSGTSSMIAEMDALHARLVNIMATIEYLTAQASSVQAPSVQRGRIIQSDMGSQTSSMPASVNPRHSQLEQSSTERRQRQTAEAESSLTRRTRRAAAVRARSAIAGIYRR